MTSDDIPEDNKPSLPVDDAANTTADQQIQPPADAEPPIIIPDDSEDDAGPILPGDIEEVPEEVLDRALEQIRDTADGNGIKTEDIERKEFEGEVHRFRAVQHYTLETNVSERDAKGRTKGETVGSRDEAMRNIETHLERMSQDRDLIKNTIELLKQRKDLGFALDNNVIKLDKYKKTYVIHTKCTQCGGSATTNCANCQGRREVVCQRCHGEQTYLCHVCNGSQFVNGPQGRIPCTRCQGQGRIACEMCHRKGRMPCQVCKGTGKQQCNGCNATGILSHIVYLMVAARSKFDYNRHNLPQDMIKQIDLLGPDIVTKRHGEVEIVDDAENAAKESAHDKRNEFHVNYRVKIPFGDITFSLKDKPLEGKLFGYRPKLLHIPPFLENLISKGMKAIAAASTGQGNIEQKLQKSLKYKVLRDVLFETATSSMKRADRNLGRKYILGIRQAKLRELIQRSNHALKLVTKKPRMIGAAIGIGISAALLGIYYVGPVHSSLGPQLPGPEIEGLIDAVLLGAGCLITMLAFRFKSSASLKGLFGDSLDPAQIKKLAPKGGQILYSAYGAIAVLHLIMLELGIAVNGSAPLWYQVLRTKLGL